jgi:hypothetical protein
MWRDFYRAGLSVAIVISGVVTSVVVVIIIVENVDGGV